MDFLSLCTLARDTRLRIIRELDLDDVLRYKRANPLNVSWINDETEIWKSFATKEYPGYSSVMKDGSDADREELERLHQLFYKFKSIDAKRYGKLHDTCVDITNPQAYTNGCFRTFGSSWAVTAHCFSENSSFLTIKPLSSILEQNLTKELLNGKAIYVFTSTIRHIISGENWLSLSKTQHPDRSVMDPTASDGIVVFDTETLRPTYRATPFGIGGYMTHDQDQTFLAGFRKGPYDHILLDVYDQRVPNKVVSPIIRGQSHSYGGRVLESCQIKLRDSKLHYLLHTGNNGEISYCVEPVGENITYVRIITGAPPKIDSVTWAIDLHGTTGLLVWIGHTNTPFRIWSQVVLVDTVALKVEKDYSNVVTPLLQETAFGKQVKITTAKLDYDFVVLGVQNYLIILNRITGALVWSSMNNESSATTRCDNDPAIEFGTSKVIIRSCGGFTVIRSVNGSDDLI